MRKGVVVVEKSRYIEMGMRQHTCRPDGGDDARTASQAAATVLVVGEKQHGALEVGAEEATMLRVGDCSASRAPLIHGRLGGRRGGRHRGPRAWILGCCRGGHPRPSTSLSLHAIPWRTPPLT
jgi:hypothetical protein